MSHPVRVRGLKSKKTKHKYGQYGNVLLTDEDLEKLKSEFSDWSERIERLSEYMASKGETYKNHLATIRSWSRREQKIIPKEPQTEQQLLKGIVKNGESKPHSTEVTNTSRWGELKGIIRLVAPHARCVD